MFDNIIESINSQLPLSDSCKDQIKSVGNHPDLTFFQDRKTSKDEDSPEALALVRDKASFLKFLRTCYLCPPTNMHYQQCETIITNSSRSLPKILSQLSDFEYIVGPETIIAFQSHMVQDKCDDQYQANLIDAAIKCPKYMQPVYCFAILQLFRFRELYTNPNQPYVTLQDSVKNHITDDIFSPILLASFLTQDGSAEVDRILKRYDIFHIFLEEWILKAEKILDKEVMKICLEETFFFLSRFARFYIKSLLSQSYQVVTNRIIPLMCKIVAYSPELFEKLIDDIDLFSNRHITDDCFRSLLTFLAQACNSKENAETIFELLVNLPSRTEQLLVQFFEVLNEAHDQIVNSQVDEGPLSSLILLSRFFKYLDKQKQFDLVKLFDPSGNDHPEESFIAFLSDFLRNQALSPYASKVIMYTTELYPVCVYNYLKHPDAVESMKINWQTTKAFIKTCKTLVSFSFCRESPLPCEGIPSFIKESVLNFFQSSLFDQFDTRSQRWLTLKAFLDVVLDIVTCDHEFCSYVQNHEIFVKHLINIINQTALILSSPPSVERESDVNRLDNDKFKVIIQFACVALALLKRLITSNLADPTQKLSYLCQSIFTKEIDYTVSDKLMSFFTVLISFLEIVNPLASRLHLYAIQMLDLLCEIAARIPSISVDSFYPRSSQKILKEFIKVNLFSVNGNSNVDQNINALDFLTHSLSSQVAFAYSFVHRLGSSLLTAAIENLDAIAQQYPDWLLSITHLLSMMFQKLNIESKTIKNMTSNSNFWTSIFNVLKRPLPNDEKDKCKIIAAKAELLNIILIGKPNDITDAIIKDLLSMIWQVLPNSFEPIMNTDVDMSKFLTLGLHPVYGKEFYIDAELLRRYLVDCDEIIERIIDLNEKLSIIDASTQLLNSIEWFLKTSKTKTAIPSVASSLRLLGKIIRYDIYPDSTIQICFNLLSISLSVVHEATRIPSQLLNDFGAYLSETPLKSSFSIIADLLSASLFDLPQELICMLEPCIKYALSYTSNSDKDISSYINALKCASEIALKLTLVDRWIESLPIIEESFPILFHSEPSLACAALDFMSIVLNNAENSIYLESKGFFEQFLEDLPCSNDSHSPIWFHLFNMMTSIPHAKSSVEFVASHLNYIEFFLDPKMNQSEFETEEQINLIKVQMAITNLLAQIADKFRDLSQVENPVQYDTLINDISEKLRRSFLALREAHLKIGEDQVNEYDPLSRNERSIHLFILRNCLLFFNKLLDFPLKPPPLIVQDSEKSSDQILELMKQIANELQAILEKDSTCFEKITLESFEFALRIYVTKMFTVAGAPNGLKKIEETRDSVLKSIDAVKDLITMNHINDPDSYQLLDEMYKFIKLVK